MTTGGAIDGRTRHYGTFYGLPVTERADIPDPDQQRAAGELPVLLVWGNCQAEALRVLLAASPGLQASAVRIPPVFELTSADLEHLRRLAGVASVLVTQPVKDDYRDLPLGSAQVAAMMPAGATVIRWPVIRTTAYHPLQAIIRDPRGSLGDPPIVPYHDLRTLASARDDRDRWEAPVSVAACRSIGAQSLAELERREQEQCDVTISDVFANPAVDDMFTLNHPGNRILVELAQRIQRSLGRPVDAADPGRDLLGEVRAPILQPALQALGLQASDGAERQSALPPVDAAHWQVGGKPIAARHIHRTQWQWYRDHPRMIEAGYRRHRAALEMAGLA